MPADANGIRQASQAPENLEEIIKGCLPSLVRQGQYGATQHPGMGRRYRTSAQTADLLLIDEVPRELAAAQKLKYIVQDPTPSFRTHSDSGPTDRIFIAQQSIHRIAVAGENGGHRSAHIQLARCPLSRNCATRLESAVTGGALCAKSRSMEKAPDPLTRTANPSAIASR